MIREGSKTAGKIGFVCVIGVGTGDGRKSGFGLETDVGASEGLGLGCDEETGGRIFLFDDLGGLFFLDDIAGF